MVKIIKTIYEGRNEYGDFNFMIKQEEYDNALFIFNDNIEDHFNCVKGGGNAIIRKYNRYSKLEKPKSAGIPTGSLENGGFDKLNEVTKFIVLTAIQEIKDLIVKYKYDTVIYAIDKKTGKLGTSIFDVDDNVIDFIDEQINLLTEYNP